MKVIYLNVWEGCQEQGQINKLIEFVNRERPDILGLSELNGWQLNDRLILKTFARKVGMPFFYFAKTSSGYNLGLFSKQNIFKPSIVTEDFNTGYISGELVHSKHRIKIILTHLHHLNEDKRLKELETILKEIKPNNRVVLMGDLNSLSPQDGYDESQLLKSLNKIKLTKFGTDNIRMDVVGKILNFGLTDSYKQFFKKFDATVPTLYNSDLAHFAPLRLDYIFVSPELLPELGEAKIIKDNLTNQLSDHYPVEIVINN